MSEAVKPPPSKGKRAVLIAGPTASGKSALALALAERLGGVLVNADSMQVYRELRILTARPGAGDEARVPHRLYGHAGAAEPYSVARWLEEARRIIDGERRPLIFAGGTGLYFEALTRGLADIPAIPPALRAEIRARREAEGAAGLHAALAKADPVMAARLRPTDPQRLARALEVVLATGRSLDDWQKEGGTAPLLPLEETRAFVLAPPRAGLYAAIDARFGRMMAEGALGEVQALDAMALPQTAPALKVLGVAPLREHLAGRLSREEAIRAAQTASRHYAKRQLTWLRGKFMSWRWIEEQYSEKLLDRILSFMPK